MSLYCLILSPLEFQLTGWVCSGPSHHWSSHGTRTAWCRRWDRPGPRSHLWTSPHLAACHHTPSHCLCHSAVGGREERWGKKGRWQVRLSATTGVEVWNPAVWCSLGCVHAHQAVICVCLTSADHARAPEQEVAERVHTSLVIHHRHSYALQVFRRLICFKGGGLFKLSTSDQLIWICNLSTS